MGGAWLYHRDVAEMLTAQISNPSARLAVAFVGVVLGVLMLGAILGAILTALVDKARLTGLDRALGFLFGAARGVVLVSMAVFLGGLTPLTDETWWQQSRTIAQFRSRRRLDAEPGACRDPGPIQEGLAPQAIGDRPSSCHCRGPVGG